MLPAHPVHREGVHDRRLGVAPDALRDALADVRRLGALVSPVLDGRRSRLDDAEPSWALPEIRVGPVRHLVVLRPTVRRDGDAVLLSATTTADSDASATLGATMTCDPVRGGTRFGVDWSLDARVALPRTVLRAVGPIIDGKVRRVLDELAEEAERSLG